MAHSAGPSTYLAERAGAATVFPQGEFEAGSYQEFTLTYTAGYFGIDDTGSLKIVLRFASDMGKPQFDQPSAEGYVSVEASNGAVLQLEYDGKRNVRPWDKTLFIRVMRGFLREGDRIVVRFGDRRQGSPGIRVQTFHEPSFEFKVLVDPWATYTYIELPRQPCISVVAGPPERFKLIAPTLVRIGQRFRLGFKGEDKWGNPSHRVDGCYTLRASLPVEGLPDSLAVRAGCYATTLENLICRSAGLLSVEALGDSGRVIARSNPIVVEPAGAGALGAYWADLHGQSEETIGTNSARELIEFARDRAFLDVMSHQGNDFQITAEFWRELNRLTAEFNEDGRFIIFPGYEWSGNTGLGGDRNVLYEHEGETLHRSHHALVEDLSDADSDAHTAKDLFAALEGKSCVVFAHIGGRYADIEFAHQARLERSIEIHSDWGTFEWLLEDAFDLGYRVGVVANSDGHKGRHGASHPGASMFGAYGGLTCIRASALTRASIMEAFRRRHHYATTGNRVHLQVSVHLPEAAELFDDDPKVGGQVIGRVDRLEMGDIARTPAKQATVEVELHSAAPIEKLELFNGKARVRTFRPPAAANPGRRVRIIWEGAEYRGRGRQSVWDGELEVKGNSVAAVRPINWWNIDKKLEQQDGRHLRWDYLTTGGFGGIELWLEAESGGRLEIATGPVTATVAVDDIGAEEAVFEAGGLGRRLRVYRLPEENALRSFSARVAVPLQASRDNPLYVRAVTEDGHICWSSPIYLI